MIDDRTGRRRHTIYLGEALRKALKGSKATLSKSINTLAERYLGMIERTPHTTMLDYHAKLYCNVLREVGAPLSARQIASFPSLCADWVARNPTFPEGPAKTALMVLNNSSYAQLVALVDKLERQL